MLSCFGAGKFQSVTACHVLIDTKEILSNVMYLATSFEMNGAGVCDNPAAKTLINRLRDASAVMWPAYNHCFMLDALIKSLKVWNNFLLLFPPPFKQKNKQTSLCDLNNRR